MTLIGVAYLVRRLHPEMDATALWLGLPATWVLSEWMRTWFLSGFPWLFVGYSQTDTTLATIAPVFGVLGVSFLVALLAGGLAWVVLNPSLRRAAVAGAVLTATLASLQLLDHEWTQPAADPINIALLQGNIAQDRKWDPDSRGITLDRYQALTWGIAIGTVRARRRLVGPPAAFGRAWHVPNAKAECAMDLVNRAATAAGVKPKTSTVPRFALWIATFFDPLVYELWEMEFVRDRPYIIDHTDFSRIDIVI